MYTFFYLGGFAITGGYYGVVVALALVSTEAHSGAALWPAAILVPGFRMTASGVSDKG